MRRLSLSKKHWSELCESLVTGLIRLAWAYDKQSRHEVRVARADHSSGKYIQQIIKVD